MPYDYKTGRYTHDFPQWNGIPEIERNLCTFATSRCGKGVTQIIPSLLSWHNCNVLVVDPKGEAAEAAGNTRKGFDRTQHILDPFQTTKFKPNELAYINPLDEIDPSHPSAFREINAIADGLIMRHDPKSEHWEGGGAEVIAGFICHILTAPEFEGQRSLPTVRKLLKKTGAEFSQIIDDMAKNEACGGLAQTAAGKLMNTGSEAGHFLSTATSNTKWLDDPYMQECLSRSSFKMSDLKRTKADIYLILPMDALNDYGRFLRLFVRLAIFHMQQKMPDGSLKGEDTFFILDEFYSLGYIEEIAKTVGGMPGFNLHLWPFLQDLPQLHKLYGKDGASTFIANSDAVFFYGVNDFETADYVSKAAGNVLEDDLGVSYPEKPKQPEEPKQRFDKSTLWRRFKRKETNAYKEWRWINKLNHNPDERFAKNGFNGQTADEYLKFMKRHENAMLDAEARYQDNLNKYGHARAVIGHPRITPDQVIQLTKRNQKRKISDTALVLQEGICWKEELVAYFEPEFRSKQRR